MNISRLRFAHKENSKARVQRSPCGLADLRRDTELPLRGKPYRAGSYRLTPAAPGLRAPARRDRQPKPRALSGRGGWLAIGNQSPKANLRGGG